SSGATATLAQWQAALRSVTYTDTAVLPNTAARTLIVSVNDGTETSAALTRSVSVTATHQTPQLGGGDAQLSYTADGKSGSTITVGDGITLGDRNNTPPTTATVAFGGSFDAKHDVLGFTPSAASGDITASYNATTGTLTFSSASGTATTAQWQAALNAVTYTDTQAEHANGSRTLVFTVGDGTRSSAPLTRTLQIVGVPQPVGVPILPPTVEPDHQPTPPIAPPQVEIPRSTMLIAPDAHERNDGVSNPLIVLAALDAPRQISTIVPRDTFTFATHDARGNALGDTSVTSLDSIVPQEAAAAPAAAHLLPAADVHAMHQPGSAFALNVAPLLRAPVNAEAAHEQASVTVTLADGAALPAWLHYDATHGTLSGTPPAGVHEIRVTLVSRDAAGNVVRREVVVRFDAHGKPAANAHAAPKPAAKPAPHAAMPPAKASLTAQFANAVATLHVPRHDAALAERQSAVAAVTPERRS
ncbi:putative Ig domain-containing protein, partial [Burkholderia gladioli]